jgi:hypothetical protein
MNKLKSHKTVEQIAKKHRLDVSFIQKQLDMGEPIEHEHTKDHELAMDIALQHLDEIPDYYTRLKKMESDAKKHHKQFKDVKEDLRDWFGKGGEGGVGGGGWDRYNTKGERIGKCAREPGEPKPKCLSKEKAAKMSKDQIAAAVRRKRAKDPVADRSGKGGKPIMSSNKIKEEMEMNDLPVMSGAKRYCPKCEKNELRSECSYGPKYWDMYSIPSKLMENKNKDHEYSMARSELSTVANAVKRLQKKIGKGEGNIEAWVQSKITKAADYLDSAADYIDSGEMEEACWSGYKQVGMKKKGKKIVPNCVPTSESKLVNEILEQIEGEKQLKQLEEENKPTNTKLWSRAKALARQKFDVYPSAYANGWASKWYKSKGGGWKSVSEEVELEEATKLQSENGNIIAVILSWRGKTYSVRMFFPQVNTPSRKDVTDEIQKIYPGAQVLQYNVSGLQPGMPLIQVIDQRSKNYLLNNKNIGEEVEIEEDWQKVNRQDKTDGLSQKAVNAYRRENPGSKLQTAVTEKNPTGKRADRRASFCRRMKGMKSKLTSAETSRDPDSRINKALRRWNCN